MPLVFPRFLTPFRDNESVRGADHARATGRSWWALRYEDEWVHEWDPEPGSPNGHRDWPLMPKRGRQAVRLYCPNGKFAQLGDTRDATGRLFQMKVATRSFSITAGAVGPYVRTLLGQLIGMVTGLNGECTIYAWEPLPAPEIPVDAPRAPDKQEWIAKSAEPGLYEQAVERWQLDIVEYERSTQFKAFERNYNAWQANACGRLVGPIDDNVYALRYQNVGRVKAEYLGLDDGE